MLESSTISPPRHFRVLGWNRLFVSFWDEKSTWIRKTALSVHVVDVDGNKLGSASTEALAAVNHIDNIPGADQ